MKENKTTFKAIDEDGSEETRKQVFEITEIVHTLAKESTHAMEIQSHLCQLKVEDLGVIAKTLGCGDRIKRGKGLSD